MQKLLKIACATVVITAAHALSPMSAALASAPAPTHDIPALSAKIGHKTTPREAQSVQTGSNATAQSEVVKIPMLEGITLTQDQKDAVRNIVTDLRGHMVGVNERSDKLRKELNATVNSSGKIDVDRLMTLMKQEQELRSTVELAQAKTMAQIHNLLSPAQITQGIKTRQEIAKLSAQIRALENGQQPSTATNDVTPSPSQTVPGVGTVETHKP
ncbi:hypothetical protein A0U91_16480 (plasmid) [Acetobacter persici]|uniref:Periplasmic heavy metal sensor n=2 Tax=Acetobacter persici TaxID=1076596 RepID=A0A1U9LJG5_9PROT|nr:hypothetical protein A0U91_16480 [Acetobacter persici]